MKRRHEMRACIAAAETPPPEPPSTGRPNRRSDPLESGVAGGGDQRGGTRRGRAVQRIELTDRSAAGGGRRLCPFPPPVSASSVALVGFGSVCCFGRGRGVVGGENEKRKLGWVASCLYLPRAGEPRASRHSHRLPTTPAWSRRRGPSPSPHSASSRSRRRPQGSTSPASRPMTSRRKIHFL